MPETEHATKKKLLPKVAVQDITDAEKLDRVLSGSPGC